MCEVNSIQSCMASYSNEGLRTKTPSSIQVHRTKNLRYCRALKLAQIESSKIKTTLKIIK